MEFESSVPLKLEQMANMDSAVPCWCPSGKPYQSCCHKSRAFRIKGGPYTGPTTLVQRNGKWESASITMDATLIGMNAADVHDDLEKMFGTICSAIKDQKAIDALHDVKHKLYGVRFHAAAIKDQMATEEQRIRDGPSPASGAGWERFDPQLVYHFEALLFQLKGALDILMKVVNAAYPQGGNLSAFNSTGDASSKMVGGKAINAMKRKEPRLAELFEAARTHWLQYAILLRDRVAHLSRLKNLSSFVQRAHEGGGEVEIEYPSIPSGMRLDEYAEAVDAQLTALIRQSLDIMRVRLDRE